MNQQIGCPDTQAIDQNDGVITITGTDRLWQVNRRLDKFPFRAPALAMEVDPRFHLLIENFCGRDIDKIATTFQCQRLGIGGFARPRAAQNEPDPRCHPWCLL